MCSTAGSEGKTNELSVPSQALLVTGKSFDNRGRFAMRRTLFRLALPFLLKPFLHLLSQQVHPWLLFLKGGIPYQQELLPLCCEEDRDRKSMLL